MLSLVPVTVYCIIMHYFSDSSLLGFIIHMPFPCRHKIISRFYSNEGEDLISSPWKKWHCIIDQSQPRRCAVQPHIMNAYAWLDSSSLEPIRGRIYRHHWWNTTNIHEDRDDSDVETGVLNMKELFMLLCNGAAVIVEIVLLTFNSLIGWIQ